MPRARKSILMKPASSQESLSHWQSTRPSQAAGSSGTISTSGRLEMIMPPTCWEMWRGSPAMSSAISHERARAARPPSRLNSGIASISSRSPSAESVLGELGELLELALRQVERLADLAHRRAEPVAWGRCRRARRGPRRTSRRRAGSAPRGCRGRSRGRCPGRSGAPRSGSGRGRGPPSPDRCWRARSGSR
jgi:hypothetical protein